MTSSGVITISYPTLVSSPLSLEREIEQAFGSHPQALGIILVKDLPAAYNSQRENLLRLAHTFANLDEGIREKYTDPRTSYSFGWSHGKEIMNGKPDTLKGSYYANPVVDTPDVASQLKEEYREYYGNNIWPSADEPSIGGFEAAFKDLGRFVFKVGCEIAAACQPFVAKNLSDKSISLPQLISTSQTTKARLLHYFPPTSDVRDDGPVDSWCGFHLDHSLLTGLCSAMFLKQGNVSNAPIAISSPSPESGLYIKTRGGELTKVSIPPDCLAFQTGEALELVTDGRLRATPHCVRVGSGKDMQSISRETFALFMQPNTDQRISSTETFGQFSKRILAEHYDKPSAM
ncbi:Clavaminate synthase-like protein [Coniophora puteana RWD-64-598 SS2]|uniref:Clavaminate synthase-like protein n=1 Tax=Coniophora puteana (strain RWD-64-598) TaxID=741705 RepID=A0A5M3N573_CONPW|nr:Clavaminate synthase-like protein [Coniophora puteana RWD-64-598 SS2]EIW86458.1 Clavaminate synthase-like protein [Coniophora puteana RWD-64-598 SS2]